MKKIIIKVICIFGLIGLLAYLVPKCAYVLLDLTIIGDEKYEQTIYEEYFENGCRASILGKEITNIEITDNIDVNRLGDYEVSYTAVFGPIRKTITRTVSVVDDVKPEITLEGNTEQFMLLNEEYIEQGYSAFDNYDQDLTDSVVITGNVDSAKEGIYELVYSVKDSSGNERSIKRTVEVKDSKILSASPEDFWLDGIYPEIILKPLETPVINFDEVVMVGDSNTWFIYKYYRLIKAEQCWGKANLNISEINSSTFTNYVDGNKRTLKQSIEKFKPKYIIFSPGIGSPLFMNDTKRYSQELKILIDYMRNEHPEICFAFSAIMPVNDGQLSRSFQKRINIYNYYLAEICHNYKVNLINYSDRIRGKDGYGLKSKLTYTSNPDENGFHLTKAAQAEYINYLKHLDLRRVIE